MANLFNDTVNLAEVIGTAFDGSSFKPLRPKYVFEAMSKEKQWNLNTMPSRGDNIQFTITSAWTANTAALSPTTATITGSQVLTKTRRSVALEIYGDRTIIDTLELKAESFQDDVADAAFNLADQAYNSMDLLCRQKMDLNRFTSGSAGTALNAISTTYHMYASAGFVGNKVGISETPTTGTVGQLLASDIRAVVAKLRAQNVAPFADGKYRGIISSNVYTQLRNDSDNAGWTASAVYNGLDAVANGAIGDFEGVTFFVSDTVRKTTDALVHHASYFIAPEFIGKAVGKELSVQANPTLAGPYGNLLILHWTALVGYGVIRREAGITVTSKATLA